MAMAAKSGIPKAAPKTGPKTVPKQFPKVPGGGRSLSAPPGSPKAPPARQSINRISSPRGRRTPAELGQELTDWGESSGLAEVAMCLISTGVRVGCLASAVKCCRQRMIILIISLRLY